MNTNISATPVKEAEADNGNSTGQKKLPEKRCTTVEAQPMRVSEEPENPDVITVTISEVDRQTAGKYSDLANCLICTALRNRGINANLVGVEGAWIEGVRYLFTEPQDAGGDFHNDWHAERKGATPFYGPGVVGKTVTLYREDTSVPSTPTTS